MKNIDLEEKLTTAAKQALDELVEDYRNRILIGATESASSLTGDIQEISVHDILSSVNRNQIRRVSSLPRNFELILRLYGALGFLMGAFGIIYFLYNNFYSDLGSEERIVIIISISGLIISAISFLYLKIREKRDIISTEQEGFSSQKAGFSMSFIKKWQDIELAARSLVASRQGESSAKEPISVLISKLREDNVLNSDDETRLKEILALRNKILHEGLEISREEFEQAIKDGNRILSKMVSRS